MAVALGVFVALSVASPANAAPNADDIVGALKKAPVYIAGGTEGTNSDTAGTLTGKLNKDDNIVLAMLPSNASVTQDDVTALAQKISDGLKGERIVGIAVGTQFAGVTSIMPSGTASDLMNRAQTVSTNSVETLVTFVRNVHDWQAAHPDIVPPPKPAKGKGGGFPWLLWSFVVAFVAIALIVLLVWNRRRIRSKVHYTAPARLNDPVRELMRLRTKLRASDPMADAIDTVCRYTEAYFKRFTSEKRSTDTVSAFEDKLIRAQKVITDYIYTRDNKEYVQDPDEILKRGLDSIEGLAESILGSIKKGNNDLLLEYKVNTNILDADRYR